MKIYTKTGDKGMTSLLSGERVEKSGLRVEAYGNVDELSSTLGLARFFCQKQSVKDEILKIQKLNMLIMAELASNNLTEPYVKSEVIVELEKVLDEFLAKLPPKYRTVIHLFYYEDLKIVEIAKLLSIKESTVKMQLTRGRKLLKTYMEVDN